MQAQLLPAKKILDRRLTSVVSLCNLVATGLPTLGAGLQDSEPTLVVVASEDAAVVAKNAIADHFKAASEKIVSRDIASVVKGIPHPQSLDEWAAQLHSFLAGGRARVPTAWVQSALLRLVPLPAGEQTTDASTDDDVRTDDENRSKDSVVSIPSRQGEDEDLHATARSGEEDVVVANHSSGASIPQRLPSTPKSLHSPLHEDQVGPPTLRPRVVVATIDELPTDCYGAFSRVVMCGLQPVERQKTVDAVRWERDEVVLFDYMPATEEDISDDNEFVSLAQLGAAQLDDLAVSTAQLEDMAAARKGERAAWWRFVRGEPSTKQRAGRSGVAGEVQIPSDVEQVQELARGISLPGGKGAMKKRLALFPDEREDGGRGRLFGAAPGGRPRK